MHRWVIYLLLASVIPLGLGAAYYTEIAWSWRYLTYSSNPPSYSSEPIPTCLGCNVLLVSLMDWHGPFEQELEPLRPRLVSFSHMYTNSSDPFKAEIALFHSIYPQHQSSPINGSDLFDVLKKRGYTIIDQNNDAQATSPFAGHKTFVKSRDFMSYIAEQNLAKNTLMVFFAFSGNSDDRLHVPFAIYHPEIKEGRVIHDLMSLVDIEPLLLNLIGAPAPSTTEGRNLLSPEPDRPVYGVERDLHFIFDGEWKLVKNRDQTEHLFYLPLDPLQKQNLLPLQAPWIKSAYKRLKLKTADLESKHGSL